MVKVVAGETVGAARPFSEWQPLPGADDVLVSYYRLARQRQKVVCDVLSSERKEGF